MNKNITNTVCVWSWAPFRSCIEFYTSMSDMPLFIPKQSGTLTLNGVIPMLKQW